jgi:hypothetical protein
MPTTLLVALLSAVASTPALAEPLVLMEFSGTVRKGGITLLGSLVPGDLLRARVVFDQAAFDYDPSPQNGHYEYLQMYVFTDRGTVSFKQPSSPGSVEGVTIYRSAGYDEFRFRGFIGLHDDTAVYARFPAGTFPDDRLPLTLPFEQATSSEFVFSRIPGGAFTRETMTDFTATIVPEPHVTATCATLLIMCARFRKCCNVRGR